MTGFAETIDRLLPGARIVAIKGVDVTIDCAATGKQIFDAEAELRRQTGILYELFLERMPDKNKLRAKLAKMRGVGGAA